MLREILDPPRRDTSRERPSPRPQSTQKSGTQSVMFWLLLSGIGISLFAAVVLVVIVGWFIHTVDVAKRDALQRNYEEPAPPVRDAWTVDDLAISSIAIRSWDSSDWGANLTCMRPKSVSFDVKLRNVGQSKVPADDAVIRITGVPVGGAEQDAVTKADHTLGDMHPSDSMGGTVFLPPELQHRSIVWTATIQDEHDHNPTNNSQSVTLEPCS